MDPYQFQTFRVIYEITSTCLCLVLLRFMIKPYQITKESRYLGLPLGFGFLGATYAISAFSYFQPYILGSANATIVFTLIIRSFGFLFLSVTYYFSRKSGEIKNVWNITLAALILGLVASLVILKIPSIPTPSYEVTGVCTRIFNLACIIYICAHTLRSHLESSDPDTLWSPLGYIFLGISQYALIIYAVDESLTAFFSALAIRWIGFGVFLYVSYRSFYKIKKRGLK